MLNLIALKVELRLNDPRVVRVREYTHCPWLFLNSERGRKWFALNKCGNRSKVEKHRHRAGVSKIIVIRPYHHSSPIFASQAIDTSACPGKRAGAENGSLIKQVD
ncbi:CGNR zinc finger domain-containing protein [Ruegeria atlantica]|uniref:CGNR zinc finger domain-containing protein n=1 Tax=Ruegeria atlantica TaxID=81569 RepID=UPI00147FF550